MKFFINASYPKTARAFRHLVIEDAKKTRFFRKLNLEIFNMGKFLKFFIKEIVSIVFAFVLASVLLGLGIVSVNVYIPELLEASNTLKILGYCILIGLPFILCYEVLFSFNRAFDRMYEEDDEKEVVVKETRAERKIRKLCEKLEKEGVTIVW